MFDFINTILMEKKYKKALVISGGGAKSAWAGGFVQQMIEERGYDWDIYIGTSGGALIMPFAALKKMDLLKEVYTNVNVKDVFTINPFTEKGHINMFYLILRLLRRKISLTETKLYDIITRVFTVDDFKETVKTGKLLMPCTVDYTNNRLLYGNNLENTYDEFLKYLLASCSIPLAMSPININGALCYDGSILMRVPIQKAIELGAEEIDVITLRTEHQDEERWEPRNAVDVLVRTIDLMQFYITKVNVLVPSLMIEDKPVEIRLRYMPEKLTSNSLVFNKNLMKQWWEQGYNFGFRSDESLKFILGGNMHNK